MLLREFISICLIWLGWWQLDHLVAPVIWKKKGKKIEVIPFIKLQYTHFYVLCYICLFLGWLITLDIEM